LGTTLKNQNYLQEEIKSKLKSGYVSYYSVQNLLSSSLLCKYIKIKVDRTIILLVVLYGCESWALTLREEGWLKLFRTRELRRLFGPKRDKKTRHLRKQHKEERNYLYCSTNIFRVKKWRKISLVGHVARM
jgi:hypothetical protein